MHGTFTVSSHHLDTSPTAGKYPQPRQDTITGTFIISRRMKNSVELGQGKNYKHLKD